MPETIETHTTTLQNPKGIFIYEANIEVKCRDKWTALHYAAQGRDEASEI